MQLLDVQTLGNKHGPVLAHYVRIAHVLGKMFAPGLETVVHDLRRPEHSIIAIYNGHITGRKVGDPATNFGRQPLDGTFADVVVGYQNESPGGNKLKSASVAIRDETGQLIGVMGLNMNNSCLHQFGSFIKQFINTHRSEHVSRAENFSSLAPDGVDSPLEEIREAIDHFLIYNNWNTRILSNAEKREVVEYLYTRGFFNKRGAATIIADLLGLTRPSVYNYRNEFIERQNGTS